MAKFRPRKITQREYERQLKKVARAVGHIVERYADGADIAEPTKMMEALRRYAGEIEPWAKNQAARMLAAVSTQVERDFKATSQKISRMLRTELATTRTGNTALALQRAQVELIQSLPLEAGIRAQRLAMEAATGGKRAAEVAAEILRTEAVTESRAMLIARTEVSKATTALTQARAQSVDSPGYIWRTSQDSDVRESHAEMEGQFVAWDNPPTLDGYTFHAGEFPNCFPASTYIDGTPVIEKLYRHRYCGVLTELVFDDGSFLSCTPNHPILTDTGWRAANLIGVGDNVIGRHKQAFDIAQNNMKCPNVTIGQIFDAVNLSPFGIFSRALGGEFHGDIADQEVDIVSLDSVLIRECYLSALKKLSKFNFTDTDHILIDFILSGYCRADKPINIVFPDSGAFVSRLNLVRSLLCTHLTPFELFSLALTPNLYPVFDKVSSDNLSGNAEELGDCIFAFSILVHGCDALMVKDDSVLFGGDFLPDRGIYVKRPELFGDNIRIKPYSQTDFLHRVATSGHTKRVSEVRTSELFGHVYNLQTMSGYYTANQVHASNCRCYPEPVLPSLDN